MERLGLGPEVCLGRNPRLVYGRMTGWGQSGPLASAAGHDLNYVALTGLLAVSARPGQVPIDPTDGDRRRRAARSDWRSASSARCSKRAARDAARWSMRRSSTSSRCSARWCIRPRPTARSRRRSCRARSTTRRSTTCIAAPTAASSRSPRWSRSSTRCCSTKLGLHDVDPRAQYDTARWPALKERIAALIATRTRDEWRAQLEGSDVCFAPVLDLDEAARHPHLAARGSLRIDERGAVIAAPAPRFSRTPGALLPGASPTPG